MQCIGDGKLKSATTLKFLDLSEDRRNHDGWAEAGDEMSGRGSDKKDSGTGFDHVSRIPHLSLSM